MTRSTHPYGSDPSQLGELFLPSGTGPFGVVVVVHGGYWKAQYDRSLMTDLCLDLAAHGLAAWNLEYRRIGSGGGWPATLLDVAAGVDLLADLEAPLDLSRVVAVGHSAGGQLALWAASRRTLPRMRPVRIRGSSSGQPSHRPACWISRSQPLSRRRRRRRVLGSQRFVEACLERVSDPWLCALPPVGSINCWVDSSDIVSESPTLLAIRAAYDTWAAGPSSGQLE